MYGKQWQHGRVTALSYLHKASELRHETFLRRHLQRKAQSQSCILTSSSSDLTHQWLQSWVVCQWGWDWTGAHPRSVLPTGTRTHITGSILTTGSGNVHTSILPQQLQRSRKVLSHKKMDHNHRSWQASLLCNQHLTVIGTATTVLAHKKSLRYINLHPTYLLTYCCLLFTN